MGDTHAFSETRGTHGQTPKCGQNPIRNAPGFLLSSLGLPAPKVTLLYMVFACAGIPSPCQL